MTQLIDKVAADYARETLAQPDYPTYNDEYEIMCAFEAGAEWADKQFEKERLAKWLDKTYEWLKENIMDYVFVHSYSSNVNIDIDTLVEDLQKAMEEEV